MASASGQLWQPRLADGRVASAMVQQHGISEILARILAGRGVTIDDAPRALTPTLRDLLPDPLHLLDMEKAVARTVRAIEKSEKIAVFGDYDVDGATASALLKRYFAALGRHIEVYIPDRMREGYGPNIAVFDTLMAAGATLIITVDCGTLAHAPIAHAQQKGADVLVLDHHLSEGALPNAHAIVNPNRIDETSPHRNLCAAGVTFLFLVALNAALKHAGFFAQQSPPDLLSMLDLVALGTVCDVMPLTGLNRAYVSQGLKVLRQRGNTGLRFLADVARMDSAPSAYHLGFLLGPRINAGGRVGESSLGVRLLTTENDSEAQQLAQQLDVYNRERQAIETGVLEAAMLQAEAQQNAPVLVVAGEGWHQGVIGIVAGRLKEKFARPAAVIALEGALGKGSARSVSGADMGAAVHRAVAQGLLTAGGGHAMAAGFSLASQNREAFAAFLCSTLEAAVARYAESRVKLYDGTLRVASVTMELIAEIERAAPYGLGFPSPRFVIEEARVLHTQVLKEAHIKCSIGDSEGTARLDAMAFRAVGTPLGDMLQSTRRLALLGEVKANWWQGQAKAQWLIDDAMPL